MHETACDDPFRLASAVRTDTGMRPSVSAVREATRVAEVGYTAVVDRMTPALTPAEIAANVLRSVRSAGGGPAPDNTFPRRDPAWHQDALTVLGAHREDERLAAQAPIAFAITVNVAGTAGTVAATMVLDEPSAQLRHDAATLADALRGVLDQVAAGVTPLVLESAFLAAVERRRGTLRRETLAVLRLAGGSAFETADATKALDGTDVIVVSATADSAHGGIVFQATVHVDSAERLDGVPMRLIELR